jgi:putative phosphoribosyl transferase
MHFKDRKHAGRLLSTKMSQFSYNRNRTVVIAIPLGGVSVAYELASELQLPLDILPIKKIGAPLDPELATGAVGENSEVLYNTELLKYLGYGHHDIEPMKEMALMKIKKISEVLRQGHIPLQLENKDIILVDDGVSSGTTMRTAIQFLRKKRVRKIHIATPVCSPDAMAELAGQVNKFTTVLTPVNFTSIGEWYDDFSQVETKEVIRILNEFHSGQNTLSPQDVLVKDAHVELPGQLYLSAKNKSWIIFAHGSGSSHKSVRNNIVAEELAHSGHGTLLFDLLTIDEDENYNNRFNITLLSKRLLMATMWLVNSKYYVKGTPIGYFGASTGAAAALMASANSPLEYPLYAITSRGGRPDIIDDRTLQSIKIPTLLIVGGEDHEVIKLNEKASFYLPNCRVVIVPHASHLFEEAGTLEEVTKLAIQWFDEHIATRPVSKYKFDLDESYVTEAY